MQLGLHLKQRLHHLRPLLASQEEPRHVGMAVLRRQEYGRPTLQVLSFHVRLLLQAQAEDVYIARNGCQGERLRILG